MKKCMNCGTILADDDVYCYECGTKQELEEVKCDEPQKKESSPKKNTKEAPQVVEPQTEKSRTEEEPTYELEEEKKSKAWIWILLALLIVGGVGSYFIMGDTPSYEPEDVIAQVEETAVENEEKEEDAPTSAVTFLDQFYKGDYDNGEYVKKHVTAYVLNKLKNDYDYDCESNDCLATWVFTAYPAGAEMKLEEGPMISATDREGVFEVEFSYSFNNGGKKCYELRSLLLAVTEVDGKYLISDYLLKETDNTIEEEETDNGESGNQDDNSAYPSNSDEGSKTESSNNLDDTKIYDVVDQMPQFPGGPNAVFEYLSRNLKYPVVAEENGVQGRVLITLVVERDGSVSNVRVVKSVDPSLDKEAVRLIRSMPHWEPGRQNGSKVRAKVTLPVTFRLQ